MNTYDIDISNPNFDEVLKTCIRQIRQNELFQFPYRVRRETKRLICTDRVLQFILADGSRFIHFKNAN